MILRKILATLLMVVAAVSSKAAVTDGAFGVNQIFDVQYYWSGTTLNASNFIAPYDSNFQTVTTTTGQYFKFIDNGGGDYGLGLYNADNTLNRVIHSSGTITALGSGAIFYLGSGFFGNVISTGAGYNYGQSASFSNMDTSVSSTDLTSYSWASTTPLTAGQTASSTPVTPNWTAISISDITAVTPTSNNSPAGETASKAVDGTGTSKYLNFDRTNSGFTITLNQGKVISGIKFTTANDFEPRDPTKFTLYGSNDGRTWTEVTKDQSTTLSSVSGRYTQTGLVSITNTNAYAYYFITFTSIKAIDTYGSVSGCQAALGTLACDSVQIGEVTYYYDSNDTTTSTASGTTIANPGTAGSVSSMSPTVTGTSTTNTVTSVTTNGTPVTTVTDAPGTQVITTATALNRGAQTTKTLAVNNVLTTTTYNPIVTTTTVTTPTTVTTTTTPVTVTTYSDNTTTTTTGTAVVTTTTGTPIVASTSVTNLGDPTVTSEVIQTWTTRIDGIDRARQSSEWINQAMTNSVVERFTVGDDGVKQRIGAFGDEKQGWMYVIGEGALNKSQDGYRQKGTLAGLGYDRRISKDLIIGGSYAEANGTLTGDQAGAQLYKQVGTLYSLYAIDGWMLNTTFGRSSNKFATYHSIQELNLMNNGSTQGVDNWLHNRLYTPEYNNFKLLVGVRTNQTKLNAFTETGDALTAMSYDRVNQIRTTNEYGARWDNQIGIVVLGVEYVMNSDRLQTSTATIGFTPSSNILGSIGIRNQRQNGIENNVGFTSITWRF